MYGVYRTLVDSESTFAEAMPLILSSTMDQPRYPWDYWSGARRFANYSRLPNPDYETRTLIDANISSTSPCWTMDENNFIASNVVAMNMVFWCSSMLPATAGDAAQAANSSFLKDPLGRQPQSLRPVVLVGRGDDKSAMPASQGGYLAMYRAGQGVPRVLTQPPPASDVALRFAPASAPAVPMPMPASWPNIHPYDYYSSRLRVFADRIYPDNLPLRMSSTTAIPYLPYSLKAVEVSVTDADARRRQGTRVRCRGPAPLPPAGSKVTNNDFKTDHRTSRVGQLYPLHPPALQRRLSPGRPDANKAGRVVTAPLLSWVPSRAGAAYSA